MNKKISITVMVILIASLFAVSADAQGRMRRGGGMQGQCRMQPGWNQQGGVPGVQLTQDQRNRIMEIRRETQQQVQSVRRNPNLTQQQRADRITQIQRQGHERVMNVLTPEQRQQFQNWWGQCGQMNGPGNGRGPGMQNPMPRGGVIGQGVPGVQNLTQAQMDQIARIRARTREQVQSINADPNLTPQQKAERIAEVRRQGHEEVLSVLTPEQRQQFNDWWSRHPMSGTRGPQS